MDLTARLKVRADDGHATPLSLSGKPVRMTFILLSTLVRFPAFNPIKPQLVVLGIEYINKIIKLFHFKNIIKIF